MLTLLVFIYENSGSFAAKRHLIYSQAVKTLVSVRPRHIHRARLSEADLRTRLSRLAVAVFQGQVNPLPRRNEVAALLEQHLPLPHDVLNQFIQDVAEITGLLIVHPKSTNRDQDLVSFMHHSFLEYYTALGILEDHASVDEAFAYALTPRWGEIVTLMFGILSEQTDVTDRLMQLGQSRSGSESITAGRLAVAFDCALECGVPPEATQAYLANEVQAALESGPGLYVSDVREMLASRIGALLEASDSEPMKQAISRGLTSENAEVAGAYVHLLAKIGPYTNDNAEMLRALSNAFKRDEPAIRLPLINAMRDLPALRTQPNLEALRHVLERGGILDRTAALQLLEEEPFLIRPFRRELMDAMYRDDGLSVTAASCILRSGLYQQNGVIDHGVLDAALRALASSDGPRQSLRGRLEIPPMELEALLFSEHVEERCRGFRAFVAVESDPVRVHDVLFRALRRENEDVAIEAILNALSSYPAAISIASLADTDLVCRHIGDRRRNVRTAAARALRTFVPLRTVTDALRRRFVELSDVDSLEADEVAKSLAAHAAEDESCRSELMRQLSRVLDRDPIRWSKKWTAIIWRLLLACGQARSELSPYVANRVIRLIEDFRTPDHIRRQAIRFFGQACPTTTEAAMFIEKQFRVPDAARRLAAYKAANRFLDRCKVRVDTIRAVRTALVQMNAELVAAWGRERPLLVNRLDSPALREIRGCMLTIESTLGSYEEFARRVSAAR